MGGSNLKIAFGTLEDPGVMHGLALFSASGINLRESRPTPADVVWTEWTNEPLEKLGHTTPRLTTMSEGDARTLGLQKRQNGF